MIALTLNLNACGLQSVERSVEFRLVPYQEPDMVQPRNETRTVAVEGDIARAVRTLQYRKRTPFVPYHGGQSREVGVVAEHRLIVFCDEGSVRQFLRMNDRVADSQECWVLRIV